jgi:RNA polymerase sigma-70 factor (ECF subfamily)
MPKSDMVKEPMSDQILSYQIKNGDMSAFDDIYKKYSVRIYSFVFGIIKSKDDAEDIVQEVFIKLWDKRKSLNEHLSFKSFLFTIAYNTTISMIRKRVKEKDFIMMVRSKQIPLNSDSVDLKLEFQELQEKLDKTIEDLPKRQKQVFVLSRREELSYKEIAKKMGISVNTVENHMSKALKFIRKNINQTSYVSVLFYILFIY